jgi:Big-like domain-containing protein
MLQRLGIALLIVTGVMFGITKVAGATGPNSGDQVSNAAQPQVPFTAGTPFSSGQQITVTVPSNSLFVASNSIHIVECAAPNGVVPSVASACDGNTIQGDTIHPLANGSFTYTAYDVVATPDPFNGDTSGSPVCGSTSATECILYIGLDQTNFTANHVWSQFFSVAANGDDGGENPGDGTVSTAPAAADPAQSVVVAKPPTVAADGEDESIVTVTLLGTTGTGTSGVPVPGKSVSLTQESGHSVITPLSSPAETNQVGQISFSVTDMTAESVTYVATDTTDSVTARSTSNQQTVVFAAPVVTAKNSSVTAFPTTVPAGNPTTITVTLRDQAADPQPVAGQSITLSGPGSSAVIEPTTAVITNAGGVATFTATDATAETVTFKATDSAEGVTVTSDLVTFGTLTVSPSESTITAQSPGQVGQTTTVTVTLLTGTGSPVSGKVVSLAASPNTHVTIGGPTPAETDSSGKATFTVVDSAVESVNLTATDVTDGNLALDASQMVSFQTPAPSASQSTVSTSATSAPADGETPTLITVTVKDQFGEPESGKTINLSATPTGSVEYHPISVGNSSPGVTNDSGVAEFEADDTLVETVVFSATDATDTLPITQTVSISFTTGVADPMANGSTVVASPTNPPSDGSTPTTVTVTLTDYFGNAVAGDTISLKALNGSSAITNVSPVTNADGNATFSATDATAEVVTFQATDVTLNNSVFTAEAVVTFGNPPSPPPVPSFCSVVVTPSKVPADGTSAATVSVLLYDGNGDAVAGKTVTLDTSGGSSTVTAVNGTSDTTGSASFTVTDTTAQKVTYTADDTTDGVKLTDLSVPVDFTATSTTSTTTTTTTGSTTSTTTGSSSGSTTSTTAASSDTSTTAAGSTSSSTSSTIADGSGPSAAGSSSTTTPPGSGGSTPVGSSGTDPSGSEGSTGSSLAFTGSSSVLLWLFGIGFLFVTVGTVGRRRVKGAIQ